MPLIKWDKKFSIDIKVLDDQHKILLDIINELANSFTLPETTDRVEKVIERLVSYSIEHFEEEQQLFLNQQLEFLIPRQH